MKKIVMVCLLLLLAISLPAIAETQQIEVPDWYELSSDDCVLTVRLPGDDYWDFEISDEGIFELLTHEFVPAEENGENAQTGLYVGSFKGTFEECGNIDLTLYYPNREEPIETRVLHLFVNEANYIEIVSAEIVE